MPALCLANRPREAPRSAWHQRVRLRALVLVGVAFLAACSGGDSGSEQVDQHVASAFGGQWPFTVKSGTVRCTVTKSGQHLATFKADGDGDVYALNRVAKDSGYPDPTAIWLDDPATNGLKVSISWLTAYALALC
jgi:hypothetical protein